MFKEMYYELKYYTEVLEYPILCIISASTPAMSFIVGKKQLNSNDIGIIAFILLFQFVIYINKRLIRKKGKGNEVPIPAQRFTTTSEDGEVTIDSNRLQEMILYVNDVESYLQRKGLIESDKS